MANDIEIIPPGRMNNTPSLDVSTSSPISPVGRFLDRMRRKSVADRRLLVQELTLFLEDTQSLNKAYGDYRKSLLQLKNLDIILDNEERKMLAMLDSQERQLLLQIRNDELRLMTEQLDLELKHEMAQQRLDRLRNPPEKKTAADPVEESIAAAFQGGGRYTSKVNAMRDDLIRKRGGEDKLTEEDQERLRNAYQAAAQGDHGRGR